MILGTLITNIRNNQILARMREPIYTEKIEFFLLEFMNAATKKSGLVHKDLYKYIYTFDEDNYFVLITSLHYNEIKGFSILSHLINNKACDPLDFLVAIDNMIFGDNVVYPDLHLISSMDSQEEKIYTMMMKNKELEVRRKQKEIKYKKTSAVNNMNNKLQEIHDKQLELTRKNIEDLKIVDKLIKPKEKKRRFETSSSPVFICFKEKIKCVMNQENIVKSIEVMGEMTLNIKEEEYNNVEIQLKGEYGNCKFSPKLKKDDTHSGVIKSDKAFSLNKNIALLKWKDNKIDNPPLEFTFWPSEVKMNTFQISLEITANLDLENLLITIPKSKLSDIICEESNQLGDLEWRVGEMAKGDSDSLEFQCKCDDPSDIFPIEVYFTFSGCYRSIGVESIKMKGDDIEEFTEIKMVREVDQFTLVSE